MDRIDYSENSGSLKLLFCFWEPGCAVQWRILTSNGLNCSKRSHESCSLAAYSYKDMSLDVK